MAEVNQQGTGGAAPKRNMKPHGFPESELEAALRDLTRFALHILERGEFPDHPRAAVFPHAPFLPLLDAPAWTPEKALEVFAQSNDPQLVQRVAALPWTPEPLLLKLACTHATPMVRSTALKQIQSQPGIEEHLSELAKSDYPEPQLVVVGCAAAPFPMIEALAKSKHEPVQLAVLAKNGLPTNLLSDRAVSGLTTQVRAAAVSRLFEGRAVPELMEAVQKGQQADILECIAANPAAPDELLLRIVQDWRFPKPSEIALDRLVKDRATPDLLAQLAGFPIDQVTLAVAAQPMTPKSCLPLLKPRLEQIALSSDQRLLLRLVDLPRLTTEALFRVAWSSASADVRSKALARIDRLPQTRTPVSVLAKEHPQKIQLALVHHPLLPAHLLAELALNGQSADLRMAAIDRLFQGKAEAALLQTAAKGVEKDSLDRLAAHPQASNELLLQIVRDWRFPTPSELALKRLVSVQPSPDTLSALAAIPREAVALEVAAHPLTPRACFPTLAPNLAKALLGIQRSETHTEQELVEDTTTDSYGYSTTYGSHYEDREVTEWFPDYERINAALPHFPAELCQTARPYSKHLETDLSVHWPEVKGGSR